MILNCPKCSTRFLVDPVALGEKGRSVRCGACGHSWFQEPPGDSTYEPPPLTLDDEITTPLDRDATRRPRGRLWSRLAAWFLFIFVIALIIGGGYRYRQDVVRRWPPAGKLYSALGISVRAPQQEQKEKKKAPVVKKAALVVPESSIKFERESQDGKPILVISGQIRNESDRPQAVGRMRITLTDADDKALKSWLFAPEARTLSPGASMTFRSSVESPPAAAKKVRIDFVKE
jgi:predicted Zn finger-like uncharacterized protein